MRLQLFNRYLHTMRYYFHCLLSIFIISSSHLNAQFQKEFICNEGAGFGAVQTVDHGYFFYGAVSDGPYVGALSGMWIKTDSTGNILWSKKTGVVASNEVSVKLFAEADSGVTMGWNIQDNDNIGRICLLHMDAFGNVIWHNSFWMNDESSLNNLERTNNGYIISGSYSNVNSNLNSPILLKTDLTGNVLWGRGLNFNNFVDAPDAIEISGGNILVCASALGGSLVTKLDSSGSFLSSHLYKDSLYELPLGILKKNTGFITYGSKEISSTTNRRNAFATEFDSSGNVIWSKTYSEGMISEFYNATITQSGNFIFAGKGPYVPSHLYPYLGVIADANGDTVKTSYLLTDLWTSSKPEFGLTDNTIYAGYFYDSTEHPVLSSVYFQNECNLSSTGISVLSSTGYTASVISCTMDSIVHFVNDSIITQSISITEEDLCTVISLSIDEHSTKEFKTYPNPASTILYVDSDEPIPLHLCDIEGRTYHLEEYFSGNRMCIDISALENGIYFIQNERTGKVSKFLKSF